MGQIWSQGEHFLFSPDGVGRGQEASLRGRLNASLDVAGQKCSERPHLDALRLYADAAFEAVSLEDLQEAAEQAGTNLGGSIPYQSIRGPGNVWAGIAPEAEDEYRKWDRDAEQSIYYTYNFVYSALMKILAALRGTDSCAWVRTHLRDIGVVLGDRHDIVVSRRRQEAGGARPDLKLLYSPQYPERCAFETRTKARATLAARCVGESVAATKLQRDEIIYADSPLGIAAREMIKDFFLCYPDAFVTRQQLEELV